VQKYLYDVIPLYILIKREKTIIKYRTYRIVPNYRNARDNFTDLDRKIKLL